MICVFSIFILFKGVNLDPKRHSLFTSMLTWGEFCADAVYLQKKPNYIQKLSIEARFYSLMDVHSRSLKIRNSQIYLMNFLSYSEYKPLFRTPASLDSLASGNPRFSASPPSR